MMAELLIKLGSNTNPDPEISRCGCWKNGDVVVIKPDGHEWGRKEGPPRFQIVKLVGVPVEAVADLCRPDMVDVFKPRPGMKQEVIDAIKNINQIDENGLTPNGEKFIWSQKTLKRSSWRFSNRLNDFKNKKTKDSRKVESIIRQHAIT